MELWTTLVGTAAPLLVGGVVEVLHFFLEPIQDFRSRANTKRKSLKELISQRHAELLRFYSSSAGMADLDRGYVVAPSDGDTDKAAAFTDELFRTITVFGRMAALGIFVRLTHFVLLAGCAMGALACLFVVFVEQARTLLAIGGVVLAVTQIIAVCGCNVASALLDEYDDLT